MKTDLYALLGVSPDADAREIKRAFRTQAKLHHPDLNPGDPGAATRFIELATAFEILQDEPARALYDEFGAQSLEEGFDPTAARWRSGREVPEPQVPPRGDSWSSRYEASQSSFRSVFERVWAQHNPFDKESDPGLYENVFAQRGEDRRQNLAVAFDTALTGGLVTMLLPDGSTLTVRIPAGVCHGEELLVEGEGHPSQEPGGKPGDLWLTLEVAQDARFERDGLTLSLELPITVFEAVAGGRIGVPTPHGECTMALPEGTHSGTKFRLRQMGVHRGQEKGDLVVTVVVRAPDFIDAEIRAAAVQLARGYTQDVRAGLKD